MMEIIIIAFIITLVLSVFNLNLVQETVLGILILIILLALGLLPETQFGQIFIAFVIAEGLVSILKLLLFKR